MLRQKREQKAEHIYTTEAGYQVEIDGYLHLAEFSS